MTQAVQRKPETPAVVRTYTLQNSIKVEQLTCSIGAELSNVSLAAAAVDDTLLAEIRSLLLKHRVLFFRDQDISRAAIPGQPITPDITEGYHRAFLRNLWSLSQSESRE